MGNILDKICRENENTRFMFNNFFFRNCTVYNSEKCGGHNFSNIIRMNIVLGSVEL
jgi:hypothetical protein